MGEGFALATAVVWSFAVILIKKSGERIEPFALNFFRVGFTSVLFVITLAVMRDPYTAKAPIKDYLILTASGVIAIGISDTLFHKCLNMVGAGVNAVIDCLYSPLTVLFAFLLLGEKLNFWHYAGMVLILTGVLLTTKIEPLPGSTRKRLLAGVLWGVFSMLTLAFGIVIAKPVLERSPVMWATAMRQIGCFVAMIPVVLFSRDRRRIMSAFKPQKHWKFMIPGTILGSYLSLILWIAGMKYTQAGVAAILNQTSSVHILIFASIFLKEPFTRSKLAAAILAVGGVLMVTLGQ